MFVTIFLSTFPVHAQQASGAPSVDEERIVKGMDDYGLTGRQKTYEALGQTAAPSLAPMLPWIQKRLGRMVLRKAKEAPLRNLGYDFSVILREDEERRVSEGYGLEISLVSDHRGGGAPRNDSLPQYCRGLHQGFVLRHGNRRLDRPL